MQVLSPSKPPPPAENHPMGLQRARNLPALGQTALDRRNQPYTRQKGAWLPKINTNLLTTPPSCRTNTRLRSPHSLQRLLIVSASRKIKLSGRQVSLRGVPCWALGISILFSSSLQLLASSCCGVSGIFFSQAVVGHLPSPEEQHFQTPAFPNPSARAEPPTTC